MAFRVPIGQPEVQTPDHHVFAINDASDTYMDSHALEKYSDRVGSAGEKYGSLDSSEDDSFASDALRGDESFALLDNTPLALRSGGRSVWARLSRCTVIIKAALAVLLVSTVCVGAFKWWYETPNYAAGIAPKHLIKGNGAKWAVLTSINYPTDSVRALAAIPDLNVVVVGDTKTPADWHLDGAHYLSVEQQKKINHRIFSRIPYRHYGRKNFGYLFALANGARVIYGSDDDNELTQGLSGFHLQEDAPPTLVWELVDTRNGTSARPVCNPYAVYGQPSLWPRGYPLENIADPPCTAFRKAPVNLWIQQGLANGDPDVDAIFRLTRKDASEDIRVHFNEKVPAVAYPYGLFSPFNSQNTLFKYQAIPLMYIPVTTTFRVCDIWRGYWAQRLLWEIGGQLSFVAPTVDQFRNAHNYMDDYLDERDLYEQAHGLVDYLSQWRSDKSTFLDRIVHLAEGMAEHGFWDKAEATNIARWVQDLRNIGYVEPPLHDWEADVRAEEEVPGWYKLASGERQPVFKALPAQQPTIYLSDTVQPATLTTPAVRGALDGCPFSDVEVRIATIFRDREMLLVFAHSWMASMPCFPTVNLIVPNAQVEQFEQWVVEEGLPNFKIWPENLPAILYGDVIRQYTDFVSDSIGSTPYIMTMDTDTMMLQPMACNALFDEDGKPYSIFWQQLVFEWPNDQALLKRARDNYPEKWKWTDEQIDEVQHWNWMSYFPMVWPRYLMPIAREVISDAQGGIGFEAAISQLSGISQFDIFGKIAWLEFHDKFHWVPVAAPPISFIQKPEEYKDAHNYTLAAAHLSWPHQFGQNLPDYPHPAWIEYAGNFAKHLLCSRDQLPYQINSYSSSQFFRTTVLKDWDGRCDLLEDGGRYPHNASTIYASGYEPFPGALWLQNHLDSRDADRVMCSDPIRRRI